MDKQIQTIGNGTPDCILVVDDDADMRQLSTEALVQAGYEVDVAEDGAVAWDKLQLKSYDLLVTDNNMPKVSGVELIKQLRAAGMTLPIIMVTGILPKNEFIQYPWPQPDATLPKPYIIEELLGTVSELLRATAYVHEQVELPQIGETSQQLMVCGHEDSNPRSSVRVSLLEPGYCARVESTKEHHELHAQLGNQSLLEVACSPEAAYFAGIENLSFKNTNN